MIVPEPFATISSTILLNIASDIVEHQSKHLEGTLVGRLMKWGGLIEPDFQDRLRTTLKQALELLFHTHPEYNLTDIDAFFRDPTIARQIGDYILNRKPIDSRSVQQALERSLMKDGVTIMLMRKRKVVPENIIPDFLACYRQVLNTQLSVSEMSLLLEVIDQNERVVSEIQASETRMKEYIAGLLETKLAPQVLKAAAQESQQQGGADFVQEMEAAKLVRPDEALQTIQDRLRTLPILFTGGLCKGRLLQTAPHQFFVSHGFSPEVLADWRKTLNEALAQGGRTSEVLTPYFSGDTIMGGFRLCGICEKLYATRFSMFLLSPSQDRNVYLELGIAIGIGAPIFLIQHYEAAIPPILEGLSRYTRGGQFRTMRRELADQIEEYDFGALRFVKDQPNFTEKQSSQYLVLAGECSDDPEFEGSVVDAITKVYPHLEGVSLSQMKSASAAWIIEDMIRSLQRTRFAIYRVSEKSSPTTFIALGISIALNRPFLMIREAGSEVPIDLRGIGFYQYPNFVTLEEKLIHLHQDFFKRFARP